MNARRKLALAARYRPQTFAEVAGQDMVRAVLSRTCADDRPACAYLFSGTRGVGKTTVARIFAKALNCEHAPAPEPCNDCPQCRKIMQGTHVDVTEIDGASNNRVEDIRVLRETVGYAPMEGRYKIFIIDEAHMLTGSAFNALLKTLEEPPPRVLFVMATTEAHKFPVTIVSRCQHFTFRHLSEEELTEHLRRVLNKENIAFDEDALRLIAKRAQGSVRDSMSLLDQTLALGNDRLSLDLTREVLGLAGQAFFEQLFSSMQAGDLASIIRLTRELLRRGVDIGFFLSELLGYLRGLFLLAQGGVEIAAVIGLTTGEVQFLSRFTGKFSLAHLHAAWQLVLEGQRSVVLSTEPSSALELLLLNLTLIPKLLPLSNLASRSELPQNEGESALGEALESRVAPERRENVQPTERAQYPPLSAGDLKGKISSASEGGEREVEFCDTEPGPISSELPPELPPEAIEEFSRAEVLSLAPDAAQVYHLPEDKPQKAIHESAEEKIAQTLDGGGATHVKAAEAHQPEEITITEAEAESEAESSRTEEVSQIPQDWQQFWQFYRDYAPEGSGQKKVHFAETDLGTYMVRTEHGVEIHAPHAYQYERLRMAEPLLSQALREFFKDESMVLEIKAPPPVKNESELIAEMRTRPELEACFSLLDAVVERVRPF